MVLHAFDFFFHGIIELTKNACYLCHRHTFILSGSEKSLIWQTIEKLLVDNQVEASLC